MGVPLKGQELLNASYADEFVNAAKRAFSNSQNAEIQKWGHYIKGDVKRQDYLAEALKRIGGSKGVGASMPASANTAMIIPRVNWKVISAL